MLRVLAPVYMNSAVPPAYTHCGASRHTFSQAPLKAERRGAMLQDVTSMCWAL